MAIHTMHSVSCSDLWEVVVRRRRPTAAAFRRRERQAAPWRPFQVFNTALWHPG